MGDHEGWAQPSGLLPGEAGIATRPLDRERWTAAEERTAQLIACIQPNRPSEERRTAVADYVQRLIQKCFNCEVFTYGSVPLKTYLPDGDIDLTAFSKHQNLKDTWANEVRVVLENEEKNENAEFRVKEVQYIQAEVKLIKCLVENIVVDISFNQVGGLCTLCFLEQVDNFIGQNHLFKRSIILIKAWCYYESRVLGAHHGLISTYALETLVLYIFHVFNTSLSGPLEVLYRFLAFFSNFDWENYCVSLWGPIPLKSLPEMAAEPPLRDGGKLLLDKPFLDACSTFYAVIPGGQESQGQTFISKHFNIVDPLRTTNNLGRSVSKGNFYRIRSAFGFGAKKLARILECPREKILSEIDQFFMNTWERHGSGQRPDASPVDTNRLQPSIHSSVTAGYVESNVNSRKDVEDNSGKTDELGELQVNIDDDGEKDTQRNQNASSTSTGLLGHPFEKRSSIKAVASLTTNGSKKAGYSRNSHQHTSAIVSDQLISRTNENASSPRNQKGPRPDTSAGDTEVKPVSHFSRAFSSPELTNVANDNSTRGRKNRGEISEAFKFQVASLRANQNPLDRRRRNLKSDNASYTSKSAASNESFDMKQNSSHDNIELENTCDSSNNSTDLTLTNDGQDKLAVQREGTHSEDVSETSSAVQDAQGSANVMGTSQTHFLNRHGPQIHFPVNFASLQLPVPVVPSLLAPVYAPSNLSGMLRTSFPMAEPSWGLSGQSASYTAVPFPQPHVPSPGIPNLGMVGHSQLDDTDVSENKGPIESDQEEMHREHDSRQQVEEHRNAFLGHASGNSKGMRSFHTVHEEPQPFNQERPLHQPFSPVKGQTKFAKDGKGQLPEGRVNSPHQPSSSKFDENGPTSKFESSTLKVTENNWMGGTGRVSKPYRDRRGKGRGTGNIEISNSKVRETENPNRSNSNSGWQSETDVEGPVNGDDASYQDSDCYSSLPHASKSPMLPSASVLTAVPRVQQSAVPLYDRSTVMSQESAMTSSSGSVMVGQGLRQRGMDNSGLPPFAFYPTGPPLPFFMFPLSYIPADGTSTGDLSTSYDNMGSADEPADNQAEHSDQGVSNSGYDMEENLEHSQNLCSRSMGSAEASCTDQVDDMKSDILRSDFDSHWLNLQYGRLCQNPRIPNHVIYPSPAVIPPLYLQGHFPWDGPGRPVNMSTITQLVSSYGQRFVPVMALQPNSTRTTNNFQRFNGQNRLYSEELPRYRGGTGTYLPNLRQAPYRDRHSSGSKGNRSNYGQDRNEHGDRDPSWYMFPRGKSAGRGQNRYDLRNQSDSSNSRGERVSEGKGGDRMWDSHRNENVRGSYQAQSVPFLPANAPGNSNNVGAHSSSAMSYGMYPMQSMNTFGNMPSLAANGPPVPSVVMLYPYDHNVNFTPEPLEFGSLGPVQLQGSQEGRLNDIMGDAGGRFDEGNYCEHDRSSYHLSNSSPGGSPVDHPSSPMQSQRSTRKSYQLKEEDFPPLSFRNQSRRGRSNSFNMENRPNSNSSSHYQSFMVGQ